jgi:hypothetical protein
MLTRMDDPKKVRSMPDPESMRGNEKPSVERRNLLRRMRSEDAAR